MVISQVIGLSRASNEFVPSINFFRIIVLLLEAMLGSFSQSGQGISIRILQWLGGARTHHRVCPKSDHFGKKMNLVSFELDHWGIYEIAYLITHQGPML